MKELDDKQSISNKIESKIGFSLSRLEFFKNFTDKEKRRNLFSSKTLYWACGLVLLVFFVWGKFKESRLDNKIAILNEKIEKVESLYRIDSTEFHDLQNTPSLIEHIAREDYYMKEEGEEIYIIKKAEHHED